MTGRIGFSWKRGRTYFKGNSDFYNRLWQKAKSKNYRSVSDAGYSYWDAVTNAASVAAYHRDQDTDDSLLSAETLPENSSLLGFKAFAQDYPEKLFPLLKHLRAEWVELFVEYYLLEKSQNFIAKAHGFIQTRVWENLRLIEQTIGSMILLGPTPGGDVLRPVITKAGLDTTQYGSLTDMILYYAASRSYAVVAQKFNAPIPAIRKIFRPAIAKLLASKEVRTVAVGAYLRSLTHQASLTRTGLSRSCMARTKRVGRLRFHAPSLEDASLISFGPTAALKDEPWCMFEISSDHRMTHLNPLIKAQGRKIFGRQPAQIFAPVNTAGELEFHYLFARSNSIARTRGLTKLRGISEMSAIYNEDGSFVRAVTLPHAEVQKLMDRHQPPAIAKVKPGDFVEILSGPAARYCGVITKMRNTGTLRIRVEFPTGRQFLVTADPTCVKFLGIVPTGKRSFWGVRVLSAG